MSFLSPSISLVRSPSLSHVGFVYALLFFHRLNLDKDSSTVTPFSNGMNIPTVIKIDPAGTTAYVVDIGYAAISKIDLTESQHRVHQWVGKYGAGGSSEGDGISTNAKFRNIIDIGFTADGNSLIMLEMDEDTGKLDSGIKVNIRKVDVNSATVSTIALVANKSGRLLKYPQCMAVVHDGQSIFIAEGTSNRILQVDIWTIRQPGGDYAFLCESYFTYEEICETDCIVPATTVAGSETGEASHQEGIGTNAMLKSPRNLSLSLGGDLLLITEGTGENGMRGTLRQLVIAESTVSTLAGHPGESYIGNDYTDGSTSDPRVTFNEMSATVYGVTDQEIYVIDSNQIRYLDSSAACSNNECVMTTLSTATQTNFQTTPTPLLTTKDLTMATPQTYYVTSSAITTSNAADTTMTNTSSSIAIAATAITTTSAATATTVPAIATPAVATATTATAMSSVNSTSTSNVNDSITSTARTFMTTTTLSQGTTPQPIIYSTAVTTRTTNNTAGNATATANDATHSMHKTTPMQDVGFPTTTVTAATSTL